MRTTKLILMTAVAAIAALAALGGTASIAAADFQHVVGKGESLSSVAAADGLSVSQLAAANGLSADSELTAGTELAIPPQGETATEAATSAPAAAGEAASSEAAPAEATAAAATTAPTGAGDGGYVVQPGDTLSGIAARYGVSVDALAAANGLTADGVLPAGRTLSVSGSSGAATAPAASAEPVSDTTSEPASTSSAGAQSTGGSVSAADVGQIASENGVSPSLAEAIGYQESGFNNSLVSSTGASGVMQIEPGTWKDINALGGPTLSPTSATDNVRGGVELLHSLLDQTGGDPAQAAAAYYQGLQSLRQHGMYRDTQRYVANVMALERRFGGG